MAVRGSENFVNILEASLAIKHVLDEAVLARALDLGLRVHGVDTLNTSIEGILGLRLRAATTADAAAWAGKDFDEADILHSLVLLLDLVEELHGVGKTLDNGNLDLLCPEVDVGHLLGLHSADLLDHWLRHLLSVEDLVRGAESSLHRTTGCAVHLASARASAEWAVKLGLLEGLEVNASLADHVDELADGQDDICLLDASLSGVAWPLNFSLLGSAGGKDDVANLLWLDLKLLWDDPPDQSGKDRLWRLQSAHPWDKLRPALLNELDE